MRRLRQPDPLIYRTGESGRMEAAANPTSGAVGPAGDSSLRSTRDRILPVAWPARTVTREYAKAPGDGSRSPGGATGSGLETGDPLGRSLPTFPFASQGTGSAREILVDPWRVNSPSDSPSDSRTGDISARSYAGFSQGFGDLQWSEREYRISVPPA